MRQRALSQALLHACSASGAHRAPVTAAAFHRDTRQPPRRSRGLLASLVAWTISESHCGASATNHAIAELPVPRVSTSRRLWPFLQSMRSLTASSSASDARAVTSEPSLFRSPGRESIPKRMTPNHALQRTPGFGVQLPSAAVARPAQSRAVLPAMKPGTARAFASRRRAHSRVPGPESLSLGSLGAATFTHQKPKP